MLPLYYGSYGAVLVVDHLHTVHGYFSGPGRFTITSVSIGADNDHINVTYMQVSHVTIYSNWCMTLGCNALLCLPAFNYKYRL